MTALEDEAERPVSYVPLDDQSHDAVRGELAKLFLQHKHDLGTPYATDAAIVEAVDDIAALLLSRHGIAYRSNDVAWLARFRWFAEACDRLLHDAPAVQLDG